MRVNIWVVPDIFLIKRDDILTNRTIKKDKIKNLNKKSNGFYSQ